MSTTYDVHISDCFEDAQWDQFVSTTEGGYYYQTTAWAKTKHINNWNTLRITITDQKEIIAGAQILFRVLFAFLPIKIAIIPKGPIIHPEHQSDRVIDLLLGALLEVVHSQHIFYLALQPPLNETEFAARLSKNNFYLTLQENISPIYDIVIDLEQDLDVILSKMKQQTRYHIRYGKKNGVTVRDGNEQDLPFVFQVLKSTGQRQNFLPDSERYIRQLFELFHEKGWMKLFLSEYQGVILSSILVFTFGDTMTYWRGGWIGTNGNVYPNEAAHWAAIEWGKSHGFRYYSFGGITSRIGRMIISEGKIAKDVPQSVATFKLGFGGDLKVYPKTYEYISNRFLCRCYRTIYPYLVNTKYGGLIYSLVSRR